MKSQRGISFMGPLFFVFFVFLLSFDGHSFVSEKIPLRQGDEKFLTFDSEKDKGIFEFDPDYYRGTFRSEDLLLFNSNDFAALAINRGFESLESLLLLEKANLQLMKSTTDLLPKLNVELSTDAPAAAVAGLLGAFIPSSWFKLAGSWAASKSMQYSFLGTILAQYYNAKIYYFNMLKEQGAISILRAQISREKSFVKYLRIPSVAQEDDNLNEGLSKTLEAYILNLDGLLTDKEKNYVESLLDIPHILLSNEIANPLMINLKKEYSPEMLASASYPGGAPLDRGLDSLVGLKLHTDCSDCLATYVLEHSFEVKSMMLLLDELSWGVLKEGFDFISAEEHFKLSISPSILPNVLFAKKNREVAMLKLQELTKRIERDVKRLLNDRESSSNAYFIAKEGLDKTNLQLQEMFLKYYGKNGPRFKTFDSLIYVLDLNLSFRLKMNDAFYSYLISSMRLMQFLQYNSKYIFENVLDKKYYALISDLAEVRLLNDIKR